MSNRYLPNGRLVILSIPVEVVGIHEIFIYVGARLVTFHAEDPVFHE
jgi:hypothetical protein